MSLRHTMLGLLSTGDLTGYDIKRLFDRSIYFVWNASDSQIYRELRALEQSGAVTSEIVHQDTRPNKRVYRLTEQGTAELAEWLASPLGETNTNDPFRVRLFFIGRASPVDQLRVLLARRDQLLQEMARWEERREAYKSVDRSRHPELLRWQLKLLDLTIDQDRVELEWLESNIAELQAELGETGLDADVTATKQATSL